MWVAAWGGLLRLEDGRLTRFTTRDGLLNNRVQHIVEGKDGSMWSGTPMRWESPSSLAGGRRPSWRHSRFGTGCGRSRSFPGMRLRGWIWLGTDQGVEVFDGRGWRHFDHTDGLAWDDCNGNAFWADADGSVWFGTGQGISHFRIPAGGVAAAPAGGSGKADFRPVRRPRGGLRRTGFGCPGRSARWMPRSPP